MQGRDVRCRVRLYWKLFLTLSPWALFWAKDLPRWLGLQGPVLAFWRRFWPKCQHEAN